MLRKDAWIKKKISRLLVHPTGSLVNSAICEGFSKFCLDVFNAPMQSLWEFYISHMQN